MPAPSSVAYSVPSSPVQAEPRTKRTSRNVFAGRKEFARASSCVGERRLRVSGRPVWPPSMMYVFSRRRESLPISFILQQLAQWLKNWRGRVRRGEVTRWNPPVIGGPKKRKPRAPNAFDAFCQSDDAPKGSDFLESDGRRCDLAALNAARAAAWHGLSAEEQASYVAIAQDKFQGVGDSTASAAEKFAEERQQGAVA